MTFSHSPSWVRLLCNVPPDHLAEHALLDNKFLVVTPVPCRPIDFITETFSIFKGEMLAKDIASSLDIRSSLAAHGVDYVLTDPSRVNQLLINLMTNGIKVSPGKLHLGTT